LGLFYVRTLQASLKRYIVPITTGGYMAERTTEGADPVDTLFAKLNRAHDTYFRARERLASEAVRAIVEVGGVTTLDGYIAAMHNIDPRYPQDVVEQNRLNTYRQIEDRFCHPERRTALAHSPSSKLGRTMIQSIGVLPPGKGTALICQIAEAEPGQFRGELTVRAKDVCSWGDDSTPEYSAEGSFTIAAAMRVEGETTYAIDRSQEYALGMPEVWSQLNPSRSDLSALVNAERLTFFLSRARLAV
jgi:hypothetical protein